MPLVCLGNQELSLFAADGHDAGGCERVTGKSGMRPARGNRVAPPQRAAGKDQAPRLRPPVATRQTEARPQALKPANTTNNEMNRRIDTMNQRFDETTLLIREPRNRTGKLEGTIERFLTDRRDRDPA